MRVSPLTADTNRTSLTSNSQTGLVSPTGLAVASASDPGIRS
jgi:hypothetical protein